ncbi:hypothetical protein BAnh1_11150 [Bartonella australis AUST/NH1]|uniref:Uncharacterized protein n=1 Tax=Bartonella australis (strain Aust/NH1) TaxID=1094489 RepID=M1NUR0_BARAA|nr:hypothetical protein [Bartonella australis]AGF74983.1 hypothetical protein BAnh1_11150 [Bartonella australis AUST/NH1]
MRRIRPHEKSGALWETSPAAEREEYCGGNSLPWGIRDTVGDVHDRGGSRIL